MASASRSPAAPSSSDGDVLVISQKIVSKAEGRVLPLSSAIPGGEARRLAAVLGKDPALVELILTESRRVLRAERSVLIVETRHGLVCANAGDRHLEPPRAGDGGAAARGPRCLGAPDPRRDRTIDRAPRRGRDRRQLRARLAPRPGRGRDRVRRHHSPRRLARPRGRRRTGARGNPIAVADEAAAAADLVRDKASRVPAAIVRGLGRFVTEEDGPGAVALRRPPEEDLFR